MLLERVEASLSGSAVLFGQFFFLIFIDHRFEQRANRAELGGRHQIEQRVRLLAFLLQIEIHGCFLLLNVGQPFVAAAAFPGGLTIGNAGMGTRCNPHKDHASEENREFVTRLKTQQAAEFGPG
jgi:hypothetical protein